MAFPLRARICDYDQHIPVTCLSIRDPLIASELESQGVKLAPGSLLAVGTPSRCRRPHHNQAFREGRVAIQDEASQLVALLVGQGSRILDCCAAPGGKTRLLAERNPEASHRRCGTASAPRPAASQTGSGEECASHYRRHRRPSHADRLFDRVLVDVPCSGTGTLARNPEIKWRLKPEDLLDLQARQLAILQAAMQRVAPAGRLVYSDLFAWRQRKTKAWWNLHSRPIVRSACQTVVNNCSELFSRENWRGKTLTRSPREPYLRTIPGVHPGDGFFAAILQKTG